MKQYIKKTLKWGLIILAAMATLFVLQITALAYPQPWFDHQTRHGSFVLYSDAPIDSSLASTLLEVETRLVDNELYDPEITQHIFVCRKQRRYDIFRRLTLIPAGVPGFNLSVFANSFVSVPLLDQRRITNHAGATYSAIAGDIAQCIAHELIHGYAVARDGILAGRGLPRWKTEGYAEYAASIALIRDDSTAALQHRIHSLHTAFTVPGAFEYYKWGLVVEYLAEFEGYNYDDLMDDRVALEPSYRRMMAWQSEDPL